MASLDSPPVTLKLRTVSAGATPGVSAGVAGSGGATPGVSAGVAGSQLVLASWGDVKTQLTKHCVLVATDEDAGARGRRQV